MMLQTQVDLSPFNTLALPGRAALYRRITAPAQLAAPELGAGRRFILGGGSNLVLTGDFDGLLLHMAIPGKRLRGEDGSAFLLKPGPAKTGTTSCNGPWPRAGRGWKTCR